MSRQLNDKLNSLLQEWPAGIVLTSRWLTDQGYSRQLLKKYSDRGWIRKVGHGAYVRLNDKLTWAGALHAIQQQLGLTIHFGGLSALEFLGFAQYIRFDAEKNQFYLFNTGDRAQLLPSWFVKAFPRSRYIQKHLFTEEIGLDIKVYSGISIQVSCAERAILEIISQVPNDFEYNHAYELVENLQLLRPDKMQQLLEMCSSIKVKRLFLYFADIHQLPCFKKIDTGKIDLGHGKRVIGDGGNYIAKYKLSVPRVAGNDEEMENFKR